MRYITKNVVKYISVAILFISGLGCKDFLDAKPDKNLAIPKTLADLQALLDNNTTMNTYYPAVGEASAEDFYLNNSNYNALSFQSNKNAYIWEADIFTGGSSKNDWSNSYAVVYNANIILESLETISRTAANGTEWDNIKGAALMFRAFAFQQIVFLWSKAYDATTAATDLGIPLRLTSDFNEVSRRASVEESYWQIIADLNAAIPLLAEKPSHVLRPSKMAAFGILARTYLAMRKYPEAKDAAESALTLKDGLLDYNTLDENARSPLVIFNEEVLFHTSIRLIQNLTSSRRNVDTLLYADYSQDDLRRTLFFTIETDGEIGYRGSYDGNSSMFNGIATDELYLIRSECLARVGELEEAMEVLNSLLIKRYRTGTFVPYATTSKEEALNKIITERRKELIGRNLRWIDIKRLNKEGADITLKRVIDNNTYLLPPNDNRFALPLPFKDVDLSDMQQNPR